MILEESLLVEMMSSKEEKDQNDKSVSVSIDDLTLKTFIKKFNEKYGKELLSEQKFLLMKYVNSFVDGGLELRSFIGEELDRGKNALEESKQLNGITDDSFMLENIEKVESLIMEFGKKMKMICEEFCLYRILSTR